MAQLKSTTIEGGLTLDGVNVGEKLEAVDELEANVTSGHDVGHTHRYLYDASGNQVVVVGSDSNGKYVRPVSSSTTNVYLGSSSNPYYRGYIQNLNITDNAYFPYAMEDENTVTTVPNARLSTSTSSKGRLIMTTHANSSKTIKRDIEKLCNEDIKAENLYDVNIYQFKYNDAARIDKEDCRYGKTLPGFIIEDLDEKYPIAVDKTSENVKEWSWNSAYLIPSMLKLIQDQHKEIEKLKEDIEELKQNVNM